MAHTNFVLQQLPNFIYFLIPSSSIAQNHRLNNQLKEVLGKNKGEDRQIFKKKKERKNRNQIGGEVLGYAAGKQRVNQLPF